MSESMSDRLGVLATALRRAKSVGQTLIAFATGLVCSFPPVPPAQATAQSRDSEAARRLVVQRMVEDIRADYPDVATISAAALLREGAREGFVLVDVRTDRERAVSTLPGAISASAFEARIREFAGRTVVAYCTIGARSSAYAREMGERGVEILNLEGSALAWTHVGGALVSGDAATTRLHVYGRRWNLAADGYETVW